MTNMTSQYYRIQSINTKAFINYSDNPGDKVITRQYEWQLIAITPPVDKSTPVTTATVGGANNLYIALPEGAGPGTPLIWSTDPFLWDITLTPTTTPGQTPTYQFVPHDGANLYWIDSPDIGPYVIAQDGKDIQAPESYYELHAGL